MIQEADHILIPLLDGTFARAQVAQTPPGQALVYLTATRAAETTNAGPLQRSDVIAMLFIDTTSLSSSRWPVIGYDAIPVGLTSMALDMPSLTAHDPAIGEALANAIHGLYPWDGFPDPDFFTDMLVDGVDIPATAKTHVQLNPPRLT